MNKIKLLIVSGVLMVFAFGCADPDLGPIVTFDTAGKGAYVRLISETDRGINLFDIGGSQYTYSVEFVDPELGAGVSEYGLELTFKGADGTTSGPSEYRSWSSSEFTTSETGYQSVTGITITASDAIAAAGKKAEDIQAGDKFVFTGRVVTSDGQIFKSDNSSATVRGGAFQGHFDFTMAASCPTDLAGTYDVNVTASWCGSVAAYPKVQVTWTLTSTGYDVDDFSFGAYDNCYGPTSARPLGNLRIEDICNKITILGASQWGEVYTWTNFGINGDIMSFDWTNDYGEGGSAEVIRPGGWPDLVLQ